ncbi:MAG: hypothetical protein JSW32_00920 [Deltaproteobacteria bacterium]|nr:MAG: hypothetical protein JSW32_00920 [Deltaproteobacteria bacterium]
MKRVAAAVFLGAAASAVGVFVYDLTDQRIWGWLTIGVLLGIASQFRHLTGGRWFWWGLLGGGTILAGWYLGREMRYPMFAWPLLGAVFGALCSRNGLTKRIGGGGIGFMGGFVGIHILPLLTMFLLPILELPTTFDYDIEGLGLIVAGAFIGGTTTWLRGR